MDPRFGYTLFMLLALLVFVVARRVLPQPAGLAALPLGQRAALALAAFVGGALGAKLPWVAEGGSWLADGKTVTTGLLGGYLLVELVKLALDIRVKTGDGFAVPLALALAVGRWGCFCNGCCAGVATGLPWGVDFGDGVRRHPTQIYESVFHFTMALVLLALARRDALRLQRLKFYLIAYGVYRFATEYIRPEPVGWLGLTFYQGVALALIAGMAAHWWRDRRLLSKPDSRQAQFAGTGSPG